MVLSTENIITVFNHFNHLSKLDSFSELSSGHINDTFLIKTKGAHDFVLQRLNSYVFKNAKQVILNKVKVSEYIKTQINLTSNHKSQHVLSFIKTLNNLPYYEDKDGDFWNLSIYIKNSKTFEKVESKEIAFEGGKLFGEFLNLTNGLNVNEIVEIIPDFHKMSFRYKQFYEALKNASKNRIELASIEIKKVYTLKNEMHILQNLIATGKIPLRITHNDTKISNALFSEANKGLCVIDTDTVMPGIIHYDFGDAVRTICNTSNEDETDLNKVLFNIKFFKDFTKGFLEKTHKELTLLDVQNLALAAKTITFIMGLRMLTDFLNNDVYYKTAYKFHNLDRAKNQFKLVDEISENFNKMNEITFMEFKKLKQK
ncbi:phosphotransferase family enzyme [Lutibacter oceani]|uniref:Phosphotransferase family enzyme n=1 Tax=Lutibacter oceani TaxID=1853311 RepID=A0A3D9RXG0_9FLAO|nr:phosphotransferase [Lutibacter oceani]REE82284.1 phosphotransferase family enzyme [Lutibacter oceani]